MGVKVRVSQAAHLTAIRYYRSPGETGSHIGRCGTRNGQLLASVAFTGETGSGWQEQALADAGARSTPGQTYVVSVGMNDRFVMTIGRYNSSIVSRPAVQRRRRRERRVRGRGRLVPGQQLGRQRLRRRRGGPMRARSPPVLRASWPLGAAAPAAALAAPPAGVTGMALDGRVELAWQPAAGATGYRVYRGTSAGDGHDAADGEPDGAAGPERPGELHRHRRGQRHDLLLRRAGDHRAASSRPTRASCRRRRARRRAPAANPVTRENCRPGDTDWNVGLGDRRARVRHRSRASTTAARSTSRSPRPAPPPSTSRSSAAATTAAPARGCSRRSRPCP